MFRKGLLYFFIIIMLVGGGVVLADDPTDSPSPNDPKVSTDANACFAGGSMEGKCALDADGDGQLEQFETDWAWECGWYLIRLEMSLIGRDSVPDRCTSIVPSVYRCINNSQFVRSLLYIGPESTLGNIVFFDSLDCAGEAFPAPYSALIFTDSLQTAEAICGSLGSIMFVDQINTVGWMAPANYYGCDAFPAARMNAGTSIRHW